jgi:hypothetical protein
VIPADVEVTALGDLASAISSALANYGAMQLDLNH